MSNHHKEEHQHHGCHERAHLLHHDHSVRHLEDEVPFYSHPKQRQRWGDHQILPHVNWGDLFFDLFYVAAAHNLARILEIDPSLDGLLYFVCCYCPVFMVWSEKVVYSSRFAPDDNFFHRGLEILHLCVLGTIVQHIRSVKIMSHPSVYPDTMIFAFAIFLDCAMELWKQADVVHNVEGGPEAVHHAKDDFDRKRVSAVVFLLASVLAGYEYFFVNNNAPNAVPILAVFSGYLVDQLLIQYQNLIQVRKRGNFNDYRVPLNLEFMSHRLGEWIMLMLGESILSLLIVAESNGFRYFVTFYTGILSVTMLQYIYFRTQPYNIDDHAMRRSASGGLLFYFMLQIYSAALIVFGGSYKLMLLQYLDEQRVGNNPSAVIHGSFTLAQRQVRLANMFSWSLAFSFLALDFMIVSHRGFKANSARFRRLDGKLDMLRVVVAAVNIVLVIVSGTLSLWTNRLEALSVFGLIIIVAQIMSRTMKMKLFPVSKAKANEVHQSWPNVTVPQISEERD